MNEIQAEISKEEGYLVGLREMNSKLQNEADADHVRRVKFELEVLSPLS